MKVYRQIKQFLCCIHKNKLLIRWERKTNKERVEDKKRESEKDREIKTETETDISSERQTDRQIERGRDRQTD